MADITPFRALHYSPARCRSLSNLVAPPYDVIPPQEQDDLYAMDPHNIVRVILNRSEPGDGPLARYGRAAAALGDWQASGVLVEDSDPGLYLYRQQFPVAGVAVVRYSFLCALKLEPYEAGVVLPHEVTRSKAREDRLNLMRATQANPEPIYGLYEDADNSIMADLVSAVADAEPTMHADWGDETHDLWFVTNPALCAKVCDALADERIWIADGHHRYETALAFRDECDLPGADRLLIALSAFEEPGLVVLPTHRMVHMPDGVTADSVVEALGGAFDVEPVDRPTVLGVAGQDAVGSAVYGLCMGGACYRVVLRDAGAMAAVAPDRSEAWRSLDVAVLHELILDPVFGIPSSTLGSTPKVEYTRDAVEAVDGAADGRFGAAFVMRAPRASDVRDVALAGDKMPPKSTFFHPKLWSGLVLRRL